MHTHKNQSKNQGRCDVMNRTTFLWVIRWYKFKPLSSADRIMQSEFDVCTGAWALGDLGPRMLEGVIPRGSMV